jgi:methionine-R-sulfoxide reductase/methionine-S-sulfoxide reductase
MKLNALTPDEEKVILNKGTEAPYSGEYEKFNEPGIYVCKRCGAYLYNSQNKFDAGCGWPSFDDAILGAIVSRADADGSRTEISCRRCGAHLGHIFFNENLTPKNTRYCVNSIAMKFLPEDEAAKSDFAYFAGGCFWCTEAYFKMIKGVISVTAGYAGGPEATEKIPSYEEVCSGATGHAETIKVEFDPTIISYEALLEIFFAAHNPTTLNKQGNDSGTQYRSLVLPKDEQQKELAEKFIKELSEAKVFAQPIVTEVKPLAKFYAAEDYHQDYYTQNPTVGYCRAVIAPEVSQLKAKLKKYLK